jgi:uncharacterized protein (TIGR02058 family)
VPLLQLPRAHTNDASSDEWVSAGLGVRRASSDDVLNRLMFVQLGFGCDQHGDRAKGSTKAAVRALRDAISFNSIPGMVHAIPGGRANMLIHVKIGVPAEFPSVDVDELAQVFPYGSTLANDGARARSATACAYSLGSMSSHQLAYHASRRATAN